MTARRSEVSAQPDDDALWRLELTELAALIRTRQVSSAEVTDATLRRIEKLDAGLKSHAFVMADSAVQAARTADAELARGLWRGALHGVPIGVKDLCYTADAPTGAGTVIRREFRSSYDATVVARLRAAGAVITGKLAMTEGAYLAYHPDIPAPVNPWDPATWAGVSSSGCAVATAAGLCFGSIGSDTGGSIRFPTSMCGVTGIKPTWGRVSRYGIVELAASFDHVGPIARSAADAAVLLSAIAGFDVRDPTSSRTPVPNYAADLALTRVPRAGVDWSQLSGFDEDTKSMMAQVVTTLEGIGWSIVEITLPPLDRIVDVFATMRGFETAIAHAETYPARADEYGPVLRQLIDNGRELSAVEYQGLIAQRQEFTDALQRVFADVDLVLMPSAGLASPSLDSIGTLGTDPVLTATLARPTAPFNVSGNPAICLPAGVTARGTPLGVQFVGRHFAEQFLIQCGHAFQQATTFHRRRPQLSRVIPANPKAG